MQRIELNIIALSASDSSKGNYALILEETKGQRRLPIIIGSFEAQAIAVALEKMQPDRPLTHDLFKTVLDTSGIKISEVIVSDLINGVFHATLIGQKTDGSLLDVDARSSDAIALAVRFGCPIYTTPAVMEAAGIRLESPEEPFTNRPKSLSSYPLEELEQMLAQAIAKEDYESASKIRDAINARSA